MRALLDIRIGTMIRANAPDPATYVRQIVGLGFESIEPFFWQTMNKDLALDKLRSYGGGKVRDRIVGSPRAGACARTIELRIRISRHEGANARCSGSNRPDQPSASCPFTPLSKTPSTSSAISSLVGTSDLPGILPTQPVVRLFMLPAVLDGLFEDAIFVTHKRSMDSAATLSPHSSGIPDLRSPSSRVPTGNFR